MCRLVTVARYSNSSMKAHKKSKFVSIFCVYLPVVYCSIIFYFWSKKLHSERSWESWTFRSFRELVRNFFSVGRFIRRFGWMRRRVSPCAFGSRIGCNMELEFRCIRWLPLLCTCSSIGIAVGAVGRKGTFSKFSARSTLDDSSESECNCARPQNQTHAHSKTRHHR